MHTLCLETCIGLHQVNGDIKSDIILPSLVLGARGHIILMV